MVFKLKVIEILLCICIVFIFIGCEDGIGRIERIPAESVLILSSEINLVKERDVRQLTIEILPEKSINNLREWTSGNSTIATVDQFGIVTGISPGQVIISVKVDEEQDFITLDIIERDSVPIDSIVFDVDISSGVNYREEFNIIYASVDDQFVQIKANVFPEDHTEGIIFWASSNDTIAGVSDNGLITFLKVGSVKIEVVIGRASKSLQLELDQRVLGFSIDTNIFFNNRVGDPPVTVFAVVVPEIHTGGPVIWFSENPSVATVQEGRTSNIAFISFVGPGTTFIQAGIGRFRKPISIEVILPLDSFEITNNKSVLLRDTLALGIVFFPPETTEKSIQWSSLDTNIAKVNLFGVVTPVLTGSVTIKAQSRSNVRVFYYIIVNILP